MAMLGKFAAGSHAIGIDIGSHSIKVVQLAPSRNGYSLLRAGSTPTPPEAIKQGVVTDRPAMAEALHALMRDLGISSVAAVAAVAGPTVVVRQVQLPAMPEAQLRKSIYWEARNYISFPVEDSLLEFQILETHPGESTPKMDVMLVAAPRDLVESRVDTLEQAGIEPLAIEVEPFSLMRAAIELPMGMSETRDTVALVDIGATYTNISIVSNGAFVLSRAITIAGNNFTEAIASVLSVDPMQAEEIKENEAEVVMDELNRAELSPIDQEASRALEPTMEELVREVRRSFAFYDYQQGPGGGTRAPGGVGGVSRVILTGGTAKMRGLASYLQEQLNLPVALADFFSTGMVTVPEGAEELYAQEPMLATATGLALREPMLTREKGGYR